MRSTAREKRIYWIVGLITLLNISALLAMYIHLQRMDGTPPPAEIQQKAATIINEELDFDETQRAQFDIERQDFMDGNQVLHEELQTLRDQMQTELQNPKPDSNRLYELSSQIGQRQESLQKRAIRHHLRVGNICTPEQKEILNRMYYNMMNRQGDFKQWRRHKHRGQGRYRKGRRGNSRPGNQAPGNF